MTGTTPLSERLEELKKLLAGELIAAPNSRYADDLRASVEWTETKLDQIRLWKA